MAGSVTFKPAVDFCPVCCVWRDEDDTDHPGTWNMPEAGREACPRGPNCTSVYDDWYKLGLLVLQRAIDKSNFVRRVAVCVSCVK